MENPFDKYLNRTVTYTIRFKPGNLILSFLVLLAVIYVAWELIWYRWVGMHVIHWHTHLFVYYLIFVVLLLLAKFTGKRNFLMGVGMFVGVFFVAEIYLMLDGRQKTYYEKRHKFYHSPGEAFRQSHHHTWGLWDTSHRLKTSEFDYWRPTNNLGFADNDWKWPDETPGQKRILTLGDSFTEGDGSSFDSTYVALLANKLNRDGKRYYFMNAGICGSDPFENELNLEHLLFRYKPDYVIQAISDNDLYNDIAIRGGFGRFLPNGKQRYRSTPWWEPVYALSYVSRLYFSQLGYDELFVKINEPGFKEELDGYLEELFGRYTEVCRKNNITLLVVIMPHRQDVETETHRFDFGPMTRYLQQRGVYVCDLMPNYVAEKKKSPQGTAPYWWPIDGHHTPKGYLMMAEAVYACIKPVLEPDTTVTR